jgi:hypothetical protein
MLFKTGSAEEIGIAPYLFRLAVNKLAINLSSKFVYNEDFKVRIVPQAVIAEVKRHRFAVLDRISICVELYADAISHRDAVFHIEKKLLHE